MKYDVVVIGSGPGGEAAAINAAKHGQKVALIEADDVLGGNCVHKGTIPSKALREAVTQIIDFNNNDLFRTISPPTHFEFKDVRKYADKVMYKQASLKIHHYSRNRITVIKGFASFIDDNTLKVTNEEKTIEVSAKAIVIATGSTPYKPSDIDFTNERIYNSDTILKMNHTPKTMIIYGAGVIGCEYASIFSGLGVKVDLVDNRDRLLSFLDGEISDALSYHLRNGGVKVRHNEVYKRVYTQDHHVYMEMESGKTIRADALLFCNGRSGNTQGMNLESIGLEVNSRGQLTVDNEYQTSVSGVFAVGDIVGWPSLASAALDQGRSAVSKLLGLNDFRFIDEAPAGIYTIPEVSSIGKTEEQLTEENVSYEVGQALFKDLARGHIAGDQTGMLKILFNRETLEILGIHCFGKNASEIVHIGQAIMQQEGEANTLRYFVNTTFNYPTMAEAYRVAALTGLSRAGY